MTYINVDLLHWFENFLIKSVQVVLLLAQINLLLKVKLCQTNNQLKNFDFGVENNEKDPKFEAGGHATISKYIKNFAKGYIPNWSGEAVVIKKVKRYCDMDIYYQ